MKQQKAYRDEVSSSNSADFYRAGSKLLALPLPRADPRVLHRFPGLFPVLRILAVERVPGPLELAFRVAKVASVELLVDGALPAVTEARLVVLVRRARLVVRAAAEVLSPVVAFRDFVEILTGRETARPCRLSAVDSPPRAAISWNAFSLSPVDAIVSA